MLTDILLGIMRPLARLLFFGRGCACAVLLALLLGVGVVVFLLAGR
jgi:hypothetical protein